MTFTDGTVCARAVWCPNYVWVYGADRTVALQVCGREILPDLNLCAACASVAVYDIGRVKS